LSSVADELKLKREALLLDVNDAEARIKVLAADIAAIERVIRVYDPSYVPDAAKKASRRREHVQMPERLAQMNKTEALLEILRDASTPKTTAECTMLILERAGVSLDEAALSVFTTRVSASLNGLVKRGRVRHAGSAGRNRHAWMIDA